MPAAVVGVLLAKHINAVLLNPTIAMPVIAISWMAGGLLILVFEHIAPVARFHDPNQLPLKKAFQIGCCQIIAMIPGISRSGATILGGELLGVERSAATVFTFYLAVPTMLGATVYELYKKGGALSSAQGTDIAVGFVGVVPGRLGVIRASWVSWRNTASSPSATTVSPRHWR